MFVTILSTEERWETDALMMAEAGIKIVRIAEFAWAQMEPEAGRYEWSWLERDSILLNFTGYPDCERRWLLGPNFHSPPSRPLDRYSNDAIS